MEEGEHGYAGGAEDYEERKGEIEMEKMMEQMEKMKEKDIATVVVVVVSAYLGDVDLIDIYQNLLLYPHY